MYEGNLSARSYVRRRGRDGVAVLATSTAAHAQRPASMGAGLPVGQTGMQMFNFSRYISGTARRAEGEGRGDLRDAAVQGHPRRRAVQPARHDRDASSARWPTSTACASSAATAASPRPRSTPRSPPPRRSASSSSARAAPPPPVRAPTPRRWPRRRRSTASASARSRPAWARSTSTTTRASSREVRRQRHHQVRVGNPDGQHGRRATSRPRSTPAGRPTRRSTSRPAHALPHAHRDDARQGPHEHRADRPQRQPRAARHG